MDELFQIARNRLPHVFWIGGPGCSGKTSLADLLGRKYDLRVYHVDDQMQYHQPEPTLQLARWQGYDYFGMKGKPLFHLPPADVAQCVIDSWQIPIFVQTIKHLLTWPRDQGIIVEGVFLPETLLKVAAETHIAVMISGRKFREAHFGHRHDWYAAYEDKTGVYNTILDALAVMDQAWLSQARQYQAPIFQIDSLQAIDDVAAQLAMPGWERDNPG